MMVVKESAFKAVHYANTLFTSNVTGIGTSANGLNHSHWRI